jgi:ABC-type amino acid transport substrate-binding protein
MSAFIALALAMASPAPLTCGAVARPGIAELDEDGVWHGAAVDACRAVAAKRNGANAPIAFHSYDDLPALHAASEDRLAFLSSDELAHTTLRAGPVVAVDRQVLVIPTASLLHRQGDLAGRIVCFIVGTRAESALNQWTASRGVRIGRLAFQEPVEMHDAYDAGKCAAMAIDSAEMPSDHPGRVLGSPIAQVPILMAMPDGESARN